MSYPKRQVLCWIQTKTADGEAGGEVSSFKRDSDVNADVVLFSDLIRVNKTKEKGVSTMEGEILAVFSDSQVRCYSSDLSSERWAYKPNSGKIVHATTTTSAIAKQSILKNRPDVTLWGSASTVAELEPEELILLTISSDAKIHLHSILTSLPSTSMRRPARHLLTFPLPSLSLNFSNFTPTFALHFPTGALHCLVEDKLISYSLLTTTPSITSIIPFPYSSQQSLSLEGHSSYSLICISSTLVLLSTPYELSLYETKYTSLQARVNLLPENSNSTMAAKDLHLSVFIDSIDLVVGHASDGIIGVQLSRPNNGRKHPAESSLLINSICRGVDDLSILDTVSGQQVKGKKFKKVEKGKKDSDKLLELLEIEQRVESDLLHKLGKERQKQDINAFEEAFAEYVWVQRDQEQAKVYREWKKGTENSDKITPNGIPASSEGEECSRVDTVATSQNPSNAPEPPEFLTPNSTAWKKIKEDNPGQDYSEMEKDFCWRPLSEKFVTTILSMIFELKADGSGLELGFFPTNVIKYLVEAGSFSPTLLRISERHQREARARSINEKDGFLANSIPEKTPKEVGQGGLVNCLVEYDATLTHLAWFLREAGEMEIGEIIAAVKVVLARINGSQNSLLSNTSFDEDDESRLQRLTHEAELALERASQALEDTLLLEEVLRLSMRRLNNIPPEIIVRGFKSGLEGDEIMSLIRILRREMVIDRQGDDSNRFYDDEVVLAEQGTSEAADIELLCDVLTCALDAVGVAGLILANDTVTGRHPSSSSSSIGVDPDAELYDDGEALLDSQEGNKLLISSLHSEVTHTVSSLQQAASLSSLISELIRHAGGLNAIKMQQETGKRKQPGKKRENIRKLHKPEKQGTKAKSSKQVNSKLCKSHPLQLLLQLPIHQQYLRNRRIHRLDKALPIRKRPRRPERNLKAKLRAAGLPIPASLLRVEELQQQKRLLKSRKTSAALQLRQNEKEKMLPLGLPPPAARALEGMWEKGPSGTMTMKPHRKIAQEGSRLIGMYSLERLFV